MIEIGSKFCFLCHANKKQGVQKHKLESESRGVRRLKFRSDRIKSLNQCQIDMFKQKSQDPELTNAKTAIGNSSTKLNKIIKKNKEKSGTLS